MIGFILAARRSWDKAFFMTNVSKPPKVLLLHLAGADWRLIGPTLDAGHLPHLDAFISRGSVGNLAALAPMRSPVSTLSLAAGGSAEIHGVYGPVKAHVERGVALPIYSSDVAAPCLWDHVAAASKKAFAVGWPASYPAAQTGASIITDVFAISRGPTFDDWALDAQSISPDLPHELLTDLRLHSSEVTAQMLLPFVETADRIDIETDERLGIIAGVLARTSTLHAAGTWIAETQDWDCLALHFDFVERLTTAFLHYMPPQMPHITDTDFSIYQAVVEGSYRFFDMLLQRYVELVGPDCTIMIASDHGYYIGGMRQPPVQRHTWVPAMLRPLGIIAAAGPGIKEDELVFGPRQIDLTPTILGILGIPIPANMEGNAIADIFKGTDTPAISDEEMPVLEAQNRPEIEPGLVSHQLKELVDLGYAVPVPEDQELACEILSIEWALSRADLYMTHAKYRLALSALDDVFALSPDSPLGLFKAAQCFVSLKEPDKCREALSDLKATGNANAQYYYFKARLEILEKDTQAAAASLDTAESKLPKSTASHALYSSIGTAWLSLKEYERAQLMFAKTLEVDQDHAIANGGLGKALYGQKRYTEALLPFQKSLGGLQKQPEIHCFLGHTYYHLSQLQDAARSYRSALAISPRYGMASEGLARLGHSLAKQAGESSVAEGAL